MLEQIDTVFEGDQYAGATVKTSPRTSKKIAQDDKSFETAVACYVAELEELAVTMPKHYPNYEMSLDELKQLGGKTGNDQTYSVGEFVFYKPATKHEINLEWSGKGK